MTAAAPPPAGVRMTAPAAIATFKGRDAPQVLAAAGVPLPARPNAWCRWPVPGAADGWCLRLGAGEYLLAHDDAPRALDAAHAASAAAATACHALLRADRCIHLEGEDATRRLLEVCDLDERPLLRRPDSLALVMLADVAVTLHSCGAGSAPGWRIWCDPTYADHVLETLALLEIRRNSLPFHLRPEAVP